MHIHIALYQWKTSAEQADIRTALAKIATLADKIPGVVDIVCAKNASKYSEGYTHVIMVRAEGSEALAAYRSHPDHAEAARFIESIEQHGIGVDFSTNDAIK